MDRTACTEPQYLYSIAIPLLPLWTIQPVQTLSAYTRVYFFNYYLTWLEALKMIISNEVSSDNQPYDNSVCVQRTPTGPRYTGAPGRLIIWRPLTPTFFKLFWPRTGLVKFLRMHATIFG